MLKINQCVSVVQLYFQLKTNQWPYVNSGRKIFWNLRFVALQRADVMLSLSFKSLRSKNISDNKNQHLRVLFRCMTFRVLLH